MSQSDLGFEKRHKKKKKKRSWSPKEKSGNVLTDSRAALVLESEERAAGTLSSVHAVFELLGGTRQ